MVSLRKKALQERKLTKYLIMGKLLNDLPRFFVLSYAPIINPETKNIVGLYANPKYLEMFNIWVLLSKYYNKEIIEDLLNRADLVKMNDNELDLLSAWFEANGNMEEKISHLQVQFGLPVVMVTRGASGAVIKVEGQYIEHPGYKVTVADTVGSGDSFLAAVIAATINEKSPAEALDYACRVGALVASKVSGTPPYNLSEIEEVGSTNND